jgi:hypothetical protein
MTGITALFLANKSSALDTQTVTTGASGVLPDRYRGFIAYSPAIGSIVDGTSNIYGGASIYQIVFSENGGNIRLYQLTIPGATNTGWSTLTIDGTKVLTRTAANFDGTSGTWTWVTLDTITTQIFGLSSSVHTCVFT